MLSHDFSVLWQLPLLHCVQRMFASQTEGELKVTQILKENFPQATAIKVTDISGKIFLSSFLQSLVGFCPRVPEGRGLDRGNLPSRPLNMCGFGQMWQKHRGKLYVGTRYLSAPSALVYSLQCDCKMGFTKISQLLF